MNENNPVVVNDMPLEEFFETDEGHNLWDSLELNLVLEEDVVFTLCMNDSVEYDEIKLLEPVTYQYTDNAKKYVVTGYCCINDLYYVFIKKIA